jgi:hypothetical protein
MEQKLKEEITKISKEFSEPFCERFGGINGSGWLIVDPLSGYLNFLGYTNKLDQIPATDEYPQVMIMTFTDGSQLIPAGGDLKKISPLAENWQWI